MRVSKYIFFLYFSWHIITLLAMSITGLNVIYSESIIFYLTNIIQILFLIVAITETLISLFCLFIKKFTLYEKILLLPLTFCAPSLYLCMYLFA